MILEVDNVAKGYTQASKKLDVLNGLDLKIDKPKSIAILGKSGSGKSTFLSLLGGLDRPDEGKIVVNGQNITAMKESELAKYRAENIGIVFQQFHLMKTFTALENVMLPLEILKKDNPREKAMKALEQVGLAERANHFPHQLSGGECQRVAVARAIAPEPKIILADEPSGNLDTETGDYVMNMIFDLCKRRESVLILVTHDTDLARSCDQVYELSSKQLKLV
ncbi:MAG: ABC transporter ATP-binding protein [Peredibacter sp.]|nr:ABC transporter ATP-binding protein [Peredibacter sp.]|tara:strand:- start:326 stop:991 length:666 start_codon:yes stop_codon:yes gene_type:complete